MAASGPRQTLAPRERDRRYRQVAGPRCPTREARQSAAEQGDREAKAVRACSAPEGAEVRQERHAILPQILRAQRTDSDTLRTIFAAVYEQARGAQAAEVIVLAAGARWSWGRGGEQLPHAVQILDCSPVKQ